MAQIIPAILATTEEEYKEKLDLIESTPELEGAWIQIDLMDHKFVENESIKAEVLGKYPTNHPLEAQLMVEYPENWIDALIKASVSRIVFPVEDNAGIEERITHIKNHKIGVGLSINPETPVATIEPFLGKIDLVLVMSVQPGFGGQEFIPGTLEKVKEISRLRSEYNFKIEVDGGVNEENAKELVDAGVDNLVIGSHLLEGNIDENLEQIWQKIKS